MIHKLLEMNSGSLSVSLELQNNPAPFFFLFILTRLLYFSFFGFVGIACLSQKLLQPSEL